MGMMSSITTQEWLPPAKILYTFFAPMFVMWWKDVRDSLSFRPLKQKEKEVSRCIEIKYLQLTVHTVARSVDVALTRHYERVVPTGSDKGQRFLNQVFDELRR